MIKEEELIGCRDLILNKLQNLFKDKAIEVHLFGSLARDTYDAYSDIDIWFIFKDVDFEEIRNNRFEYFNKLGEIININEPPQNAPIGGLHSALIIKSDESLIIADVYICPESTSFITTESKKIFGIDLPVGTAGLNPQKITVDENYRIDFFIGFIFNTIKKIKRGVDNPFEDVIREYNYLEERYGIKTEPILNNDLFEIIEKTKKVGNPKQCYALKQIENFAKNIIVD